MGNGRRACFGFVMPMALVALVACSRGEPPEAQLGASAEALAGAERAGAQEYAPVELRTAREKLERARKAVSEREYEEARRWAEQAQVDAELAEMRAESAVARAAADAVRRDIETLRDELGRPAMS